MGEAPCWRRTDLWCEGRLLAGGGQTCGVRGGSLLQEDRPVGEGRLLAGGGQACGVRGGSLLEEDRPVGVSLLEEDRPVV